MACQRESILDSFMFYTTSHGDTDIVSYSLVSYTKSSGDIDIVSHSLVLQKDSGGESHALERLLLCL